MGVWKWFICLNICLLSNIGYKSVEGSKAANVTQSTNSHFHLITVDIKNKFSSEGLQYSSNKSLDSHIFTANPGFLINKVIKHNKVLWDAEDYGNVYGIKVFVGFNEFHERVFRVYFLLPEPPQLRSLDEDIVLPKSKDADGNDVYLIGANIQVKKSTKLVTYYRDPYTRVEVFAAREPYRLGLLMNGDRKVWRYKQGPFPDSVHILMDRNGNPYCRFGLPAPESGPDPTPISLDVKIKKSTDEVQYDYDSENETHTFTPNPGFLIYEIRKREELLWSCEKGVYPEKVCMRLDEHGNPEIELDFPAAPSQRPRYHADIDIITKGSRIPNNRRKYTLTRPSSGRLKYEFKPNAQCTMVRSNGRILWIYGNFNCRDFPTAVLCTNDSVIDIHFRSGFIKYLRLPNGNWSKGIPHNLTIPYFSLCTESKHTS